MVLELKNVSYQVKDQSSGEIKHILNNISFTMKDNDFACITGPNGSGKSTLAKIIMGIVKPTSGKIYFDGKDITDLEINERAKLGIGFAFQQPVKFKGLSVKDLIELSAAKQLNINEICNYLSNVGLCARDYINREVNDTLSGGELKRIEIAISYARQSKLTIFDEPEAGIDLWSFNNLIKVFENIKNNLKGCTIVISHQERLLSAADYVILLENGKIVNVGTPKDTIKNINTYNMCKKGEVND